MFGPKLRIRSFSVNEYALCWFLACFSFVLSVFLARCRRPSDNLGGKSSHQNDYQEKSRKTEKKKKSTRNKGKKNAAKGHTNNIEVGDQGQSDTDYPNYDQENPNYDQENPNYNQDALEYEDQNGALDYRYDAAYPYEDSSYRSPDPSSIYTNRLEFQWSRAIMVQEPAAIK